MFYFPITRLHPGFEGDELTVGPAKLLKRMWQTSTFDIYSLAAHHDLNLSNHLVELYLPQCGMEIGVESPDIESARDTISIIRLMLALEGVSPFLSPLVSNYSVNEYSGLNWRDSGRFNEDFPEPLKIGITSKTAKVSIWANDLSFSCISIPTNIEITAVIWNSAISALPKWVELEKRHPELEVIRATLASAPSITPLGTSLLHIWQGIESLFSTVDKELSFRLSFSIAQLTAPILNPLETYKVTRQSYGDRSKAAHGGVQKITSEQWLRSWNLAMGVLKGVLARGCVPSEHELLKECFSRD